MIRNSNSFNNVVRRSVSVRPLTINSRPSFKSLNAGEFAPDGGLTGASGLGSPCSVNFGTYYPTVVPPPSANAPIEEKLAFTHYQLDSIRRDSEVAEGLVLVSRDGDGQDRLEGGASHCSTVSLVGVPQPCCKLWQRCTSHDDSKNVPSKAGQTHPTLALV
jgi:hypothetical protein